MEGRTYRYFNGKPLYPFGYGLSYTDFEYNDLRCDAEVPTGRSVKVEVSVRNTGKRDGDEVVQLYVQRQKDGNTTIPNCALKGFRRVHLKRGETKNVVFELTPQDLSLTTPQGNWVENSGNVQIFVGGGQPGYAKGLRHSMNLTGEDYQTY